MEMWKALTEFTKELFGVDVVSSDLPEGVQHANRVQFLGAGVGWIEATRTAIVNLSGGSVIGLVTKIVPGLVSEFPEGQTRLFSSDGTQQGGQWDVCTLGMLNQAIEDHSVGLAKLHSGGAEDGQVLAYNATSGCYEPGPDGSIDLAQGANIQITWNEGHTVATIACTASFSHGNLAGGNLHDVATTTIAGFESAADKQVVDASITSITSTGGTITPTRDGHVVNLEAVVSSDVVYYKPVQAIIYEVGKVLTDTPGELFGGATEGVSRFWLQSGGVYDGIYIWRGVNYRPLRAPDMLVGAVIDLTKRHIIPVQYSRETGRHSSLIWNPSTEGAYVVGTSNATWVITGQDQYGHDLITHVPCYCAAICDIPSLTNIIVDPEVWDGVAITPGMRVFLPLQTTDPASKGIYDVTSGSPSGRVSLTRSSDLDNDCICKGSTIHEVSVLWGDRWGAGHKWSWALSGKIDTDVPSVKSLCGRHVIYGQFGSSESDVAVFSSERISEKARTVLEVRGKITIDPASFASWAATEYSWSVYDSSALNNSLSSVATGHGSPAYFGSDESGHSTYVHLYDDSQVGIATAASDNSYYPTGNTSCWRIVATSSEYSSPYGRILLSLPTGYFYRVRVKARNGSSGVATVRHGSSIITGAQVAGPPSVPWETLDTGAFTVSSGEYLHLTVRDNSAISTVSNAYFAHLQIDRRKDYVEPANNLIVDISRSTQGDRWNLSTEGWEQQLAVSSSIGLIKILAKGYTRNVDLVVDAKGYCLLDDTLITFDAGEDTLGYNFG